MVEPGQNQPPSRQPDSGVAPNDGAPELRVAAFGDSMMWGQGLAETDKFKHLVTASIGRAHHLPARLVYDRSRSGAQVEERAEQRSDFIDTFPYLFHSQAERLAFIGRDESPAEKLYGEIPATFPIIQSQISMCTDTLGAT